MQLSPIQRKDLYRRPDERWGLNAAFSPEVARELGYQKYYPKWWVIPGGIIAGLLIGAILLAIVAGITHA